MSSNRKNARSSRISAVIILLCIIGIAVIAGFPIYWMFNTSLLPTNEMFTSPPRLWPSFDSLGGFSNLFQELEIAKWMSNSAFIAVGTTFASLGMALFAAYAISRRKFRGRGFIGFIMFATQMLPEALLVIPLYALFISLGLINNLWGLILVNAAFVMPIIVWVLKGAIDSIPHEIEEAAIVDGCSILQIQRLIIWPLIAPSIVAGAVLAFFHAWNEYLFATTFILDMDKRVASTGLASLIGELTTPLDRVMSASLLYTLPPIIFFLIVQRRIVDGLTSGGIKG